MTPVINNDVNSLNPVFRKKFDAWRAEVIAKYPHARVFEARRSQERQNRLYAQWRTRPWKIVTRTLESNHRNGNAVDIVFLNNWKLERSWPYWDLIEMAKKYWIENLAPRELCHFQDDWTEFLNHNNIENEKPTNPLEWLSTEDITSLFELQKDKIRNGELLQLDKRMLVIVARIYKNLKK